MYNNSTPSSSTVATSTCYTPFNKVSWAAIFAGVVVAITISILLNLLGAGLGFSAFTPDMDRAKTLSIATMFWMFFAGTVSLFIGGWVSSYLSGVRNLTKGYWQGFIVAAVTTLLTLMIAASALGQIVSGGFNVARQITSLSSSAVSNGLSGASSVLTHLPDADVSDKLQKLKNTLPASLQPAMNQIINEVKSLSDSINSEIAAKAPTAGDVKEVSADAKEKMQQYKSKVAPAFVNFFQSINTADYDNARKELVNVLSNVSGKSQQEIEAKLQEWQQKYEALVQQAKDTAEKAAKAAAATLSTVSFIGFFLILVGLIAAGIGGLLGAKRSHAEEI